MTNSLRDRFLRRPAASSDARADSSADRVPLTSILGASTDALGRICFTAALALACGAGSGCAVRFALPLGIPIGGPGAGETMRRSSGTSQLFSISSRSFCWSLLGRLDFLPLLMCFSNASGSLRALISAKSSSMTSESVSTSGGRGYGQSSESVSNGMRGRGLGAFLEVDDVEVALTRGWAYIDSVDAVSVEPEGGWKCTSEVVSISVVCR